MNVDKIKINHYYWLDLLRFLAALAVVVSHSKGLFIADFADLSPAYQTPIVRVFLSFISQGHLAVLCFFVLSGFLVGGKTLEKIINNSFSYKLYCIDRFVRIMLPLLPSLLLIIIVNVIIGKNYSAFDYLGNLLSLQGVVCDPVSGPLWSLSYEVWCYILMFGIASFFLCGKGLKYGLFVLLVTFLVYTKLHVVYLFVWLLGLICYFMYLNIDMWKIKRINRKISFIVNLLFLLVFDIMVKYYFQKNIQIRYIGELMFSFCFVLLVLNIIQITPKSRVMNFIDSWGSKMAKFSYTLYLSHYAILQLLNLVYPKSCNLDIQTLGIWLLSVIACVLSAYFLYLIGEKHTYGVKQYIKTRIK